MRSLLILSLCIPAVAVADTKLDKYNGSATTELAEIVDLPLQQGIYGDELPYIQVTFSDEEGAQKYLFLVDMSSDKLIVSSEIADEHGDGVATHNKAFWRSLGLKKDEAKYKTGGKIETTNIEAMYLGGLTLNGVQARVASLPSAPLVQNSALNLPSTVSGLIGVGALDLGVSILPSEGLVRFAPESQAGELISQVGTPIPYTPVESQIVKTYLGEEFHPGFAGVAEITSGDKTLMMTLDTASLAGLLVPQAGLKKGPKLHVGDVDVQFLPMSAGELALGEGWFARSGLGFEKIEGFQGSLGYDVLRGFNVAYDPSGQTALAPADSQQREWSIEDYISQQDQALEELDEGDESAEAEEGEEADNSEAKAGILNKKAIFQLVANDFDGAISSMEEVTELTPEPCGVWQDLSLMYWAGGHFDKAIEASQKGLDRYSAWMSLTKEEREEIQEMSDEEQEAAGVQPQDMDGCSTLAGYQALYKMGTGEPGAATKLYAEHGEDYLDAELALHAGVAKMMQDHMDEAQGPLRQALKLSAPEYSSTPMVQFYSRVALSKIYLDKGDKEQAYENWMRESDKLANDYLALGLLQEITGEGAIDELQKLAKKYPDYSVLKTVLGMALMADGQDAKGESALKKAAELLAQEQAYRPQIAAFKAYEAYHHYLLGDLEAAEEAAKAALELNPDQAYALLTMCYVEAHRQNKEAAEDYLDKAKTFAAAHILFYYLEVPEVAPPRVVITDAAIEIHDVIYFNSSEATIMEKSFDLLDELAAIILEHEELVKISVEGHTDASGIARKNKKLSEERAQSVVDYLVSKGISEDHFQAVGHGQEKPIASNETEEGKAQNRRVEFIILERAED